MGSKKIKDMFSPIKNSKYPAITVEEEAISIPLQTMCGAIFDAILVHMMTVLAPDSWQGLRTGMCDKLNRKKNHRTLNVSATHPPTRHTRRTRHTSHTRHTGRTTATYIIHIPTVTLGTVEILETTYKDADIQFLQEVAATFIDAAGARPLVTTHFDLHYPLAIDKGGCCRARGSVLPSSVRERV